MPASKNTPAARQFFIDWLRIGAFALLVLYHVGMYYVTWDWHVKSPQASAALEPLMGLFNPWRMGLLFLVSGAAIGWSLNRGTGNLLAERSVRLLLPLLTGIVLIVPPQSYYEAVQKFGYAGGYVQFLFLYFQGYGEFCKESACLHLPTWNHLWFLPYVWLYTVVFLIVRVVLPVKWRKYASNWFAARPSWQLWMLPILALTVVRLTLLSRYPSTHALIGDRFNHATYGLLFLIGTAFALQPKLFERLQGLRWPALVVTLLCWMCISWYVQHVSALGTVPEDLRVLQRVGYATMQWSAIVAVMGFAHRHLNRDHRWRAALSESVFPLYLLHQTAIVVLAVNLLPLHLNVAAEATLLVLLVFATCFAFWRVARLTGWLRPLFGLPRRMSLAAALPAPAQGLAPTTRDGSGN